MASNDLSLCIFQSHSTIHFFNISCAQYYFQLRVIVSADQFETPRKSAATRQLPPGDSLNLDKGDNKDVLRAALDDFVPLEMPALRLASFSTKDKILAKTCSEYQEGKDYEQLLSKNNQWC